MKRKRTVFAVAAVVLVVFEGIVWADDSDWDDSSDWSVAPGDDFSAASVDVYGYTESSAVTRLADGSEEDPLWGTQLRTRLKMVFQPQDEIAARLELTHDIRNGIANDMILANHLGINPAPAYQSTDPNDDYLGTLAVDHAYATVNLGVLDLAIGKQPIAWGSAYLFNPTDHVGSGASLEGRGAETPGTPAVVPTIYLGPVWALGGYISLQQQGAEQWALSGSANAQNLPFGVRLRGYVGTFDLTFSFANEVRYVGAPGGYTADGAAESYRRQYYGGFDTIGSIGDIGLYSEISLGLPQKENRIDFGETWDPEESVSATFGIEYTFHDGWSGGGLQLKAEYTHLGPGESRTSDYDPVRVLEGSAITMAEDYLFLYGSRTCCTFLEVTLGALTNLNDGSVLLAPEASYSFHDNFEATVEASVPVGKDRTEYAGPFSDDGIAGVDLIDPEIRIALKASF